MVGLVFKQAEKGAGSLCYLRLRCVLPSPKSFCWQHAASSNTGQAASPFSIPFPIFHSITARALASDWIWTPTKPLLTLSFVFSGANGCLYSLV